MILLRKFDLFLLLFASSLQMIPCDKFILGSHLNVIEASITMARDFLMVRLLYLFGVWKYTDSIL